jgi:hypothetical protein
MSDQTPKYRRWYDFDPVLVEVLELLRTFKADVRAQAEVFVEKIESQVGKEAVDKFYAMSRPEQFGNRWYDHDPVVSKAIELLRVVPPDAQRQAAMRFLESLKKQGITKESMSTLQRDD